MKRQSTNITERLTSGPRMFFDEALLKLTAWLCLALQVLSLVSIVVPPVAMAASNDEILLPG